MKPTIHLGALFVVASLAGCGGGATGGTSGASAPAAAPSPSPSPQPGSPLPPPPSGGSFVLQVATNGSGTVTSSPAGINCNGSTGCSQSFASEAAVTLTAAPATGYGFSGWSGGCTGTSTTCNLTISAAQSVVATFAASTPPPPPPGGGSFVLQVATNGSGTVTSSPAGINCNGSSGCSQSFASGAAVTLTAAPATGYGFSGWSGGCTGTTTTCNLTISAAQSVLATFAASTPLPPPSGGGSFVLQVATNGSGTVTSSPAGISCNGSTGCSQSFASGTAVTLTAAPATGYGFSGWSGGCTGTTTTCNLTISAAQSVLATFAASTPPPTAGQRLVSASFPSGATPPYKFFVTASNGPIPAVQQPYEVWPLIDANGYPYFGLDVSATGPFGAWTSAQIQSVTVSAVAQTGWITSGSVGVTLQ